MDDIDSGDLYLPKLVNVLIEYAYFNYRLVKLEIIFATGMKFFVQACRELTDPELLLISLYTGGIEREIRGSGEVIIEEWGHLALAGEDVKLKLQFWLGVSATLNASLIAAPYSNCGRMVE